MSKQNNLTDFLTDVADAIRTKKGTSLPINPQNFSSEIASISGGESGGGGNVIPGEGQHLVTFIDYDGTVLKKEAVNDGESATPPATAPEHEHLTFNKWVGNYSNVTRDRIVGAHYNSADGNTWMRRGEGKYVKLYLVFTGEIIINWGDGVSETITSGNEFIHKYKDNQKYWISLSGGNITALSRSNDLDTINIDMLIIGANCKGVSMFGICYSLKLIVIPEGIKSISNKAFSKCPSLVSIVIPDGVTSIGSEAFNNCFSLVSIVIPDGVTSIDGSAFNNCYSLTYVVIPNTVTYIGSSAFYSCYSLKRISIPNAVTYIGDAAFRGSGLFGAVDIPDTVTYIGSSAFSSCYSITSVVISGRINTIDNNTFTNCYSLSSIVIPDSVTLIKSSVLYSCTFLQYIYIKATTPPELYSSSISTVGAIYVPDESVAAYQAATNWSSFADRIKGISEMPAE